MPSPYIVRILKTDFITPDVKSFIVDKPGDYEFEEGQDTNLTINTPEWNTKPRPFTPTSTNEDLILEFIIKSYPEHNGVTKKLHTLNPGDELILDKPFGSIHYKGPGIFIAGGTGITPFISIFRKLKKQDKLEGNKLIFANKTHKDIICEKKLIDSLGEENITFILSEESYNNYSKATIDKEFLEKQNLDKSKFFYICGPPQFTNSIVGILLDIGVDGGKIIR
jgi:ferredoxin-NADP reductase